MIFLCCVQKYFDRFISETPLPQSLWSSSMPTYAYMNRLETGPVAITKLEDNDFVELLSRAYNTELVDVEVKAVFDPVINFGSLSLEVILLHKVSVLRGLLPVWHPKHLHQVQIKSRYDGIFFFQVLFNRWPEDAEPTQPNPQPGYGSDRSAFFVWI